MPTYTYRCSNCNTVIEVKQSINDDKLTHCVECYKDTLERVIQAPAVVFKGQGWFKTSGRY